MVNLQFESSSVKGIWLRVTSVSVIFFFIATSDAMLSYWLPTFVQDNLNSSFLMGVVLSFSSVVGLAADLILPQIVHGLKLGRLLTYTSLISLAFAISLLTALFIPNLLFVLFAVALWGVYYELLGFSRQQYVADASPYKLHAGVTALMTIFLSLAYTLGPVIVNFLLVRGNSVVITFAAFLTLTGFFLSRVVVGNDHKHVHVTHRHINIWEEFSRWKTLFTFLWPMIILSILLGVIDSVFWTTGAVFSEKLAKENVLGAFLVPAYMFPSIFMGLVIIRMHIYKHKKKFSQVFSLVAGVFLALAGLSGSVSLLLIFVFASSVFIALARPLVDAVYADIVSRMENKGEHLIGMSHSAWSLAYIIGPIFSGLISALVGEKATLTFFGFVVAFVSFLLILFTKKKLLVPHREVNKWR